MAMEQWQNLNARELLDAYAENEVRKVYPSAFAKSEDEGTAIYVRLTPRHEWEQSAWHDALDRIERAKALVLSGKKSCEDELRYDEVYPT